MKKGKVLGKGHIAVVVMLLALGAAVWLNMKFSSDKYLGEAKYVDNSSDAAVETAAKVEEKAEDYFKEAKKEREEVYETAKETVEELLDNDKFDDNDKKQVIGLIESLAKRIEHENNIETVLKAKGFEKIVAVIGEKGINIVVASDGLTTAQTLQIQDVVTGETDIDIGNIKIVAVK